MAISGTKGRVESYSYPVYEGHQYINLNPGRLFIQQPPKKGKGSRGKGALRGSLRCNIKGCLEEVCFEMSFKYREGIVI